MPVTYCHVFSFLWRSIQSMGCFFDCFRVRHHNHHPRHHPLPTSSSPSSAAENGAEKMHLSSLFAPQEKDECVVKEQENLVRRVGRLGIDEGLLEEVKLLKACGTLPETPAEIRRAVKFSEHLEISELKMPQSALKSSPYTPAAIRTEEILPENLESADSRRIDSAVESSPETPEEKQNVEPAAGISEKSDIRGPRSMVKASPYPTPRKITDDMQTPGTVFATNMKSLTKGNARIRSQYVYTASNPIDSKCQFGDIKEELNSPPRTSDLAGESLSQPGEATPLPSVGSNGKSVIEERLGDASLSSWLKPPPAPADGDCHTQDSTSTTKPDVRKSPADRPIIGLVATHWNEQEQTPHVPPKWWDGNGIPNSTTKYKEDQKVRWHATPFEERLEKALSEETCVAQRKLVTGAPIIFEESEGQDTATSQLQTAPKSVVSF